MNNRKTIILLENLNKVIKGKKEVLELVLITLFSRGHLLIEDVPGVGKTTLVKALAKSMDLSYKRIQFTPDIMPSDIIGVSIYDKHTGNFTFKKGPIFSQIFLADEINRTSPKTQSSLLQAMEEGEISTENAHFILEKPFMVLATQNPLEYGGTFPLPEAQLDRFLMKISLGYPDKINEKEILKNYSSIGDLSLISSVLESCDILEIQGFIDNLTVHEDIMDYIVNISNATRECKDLELGASPRASIDLLKASKAKAFLSGRNYVIPDDIKQMVYPVFLHRIVLSPGARIERKNKDTILKNILNNISIPVIKDA
ncbi:AAA family ATPase [Tissierella creatinophila]|uniref:ATPase family associated with various cellular activitie (AAA) n=1 Tax=Tissierella creatinophila DSM 6911 TaxID=1123403 RepID=A0A1U7M8H9_TISCR|nr:MoxR family ATPase [Tissierella creatinophila]OLS03622.1 ATPase family associated with various cellular activitie (AAA) [Tissierella creatinophila DSM 6911]